MDPITIGAIATAAPIVGGMIGGAASAGDRASQTQVLKDLYAKYANLQIPDTEKMKLALEDFKSAGPLTMGTETAQQLGAADAFQDIAVDPRLRQAQMDQLQAMSRLGETSFTPAEQAQLNKMQRSVEADSQARLRQLLQQQEQRGVGSSDAALAARLQSAQSGANIQATQADDLAAMAFNRALQAKQAAGQLGGQMENVQYGQASNLAKALNEREMQNMMQRAGAGSRNIDRFNTAQMYNIKTAQDIADRNVAAHNYQQEYNKQLEQRAFENQLKKLQSMGGAAGSLASNYGESADRTAAMWGNIGGGAGKILGGVGMSKPTDASTQANPLGPFLGGKQLPASNKYDGTVA